MPGCRSRALQLHLVRDINGPGLLEELLDLVPALPNKGPPVLFLTNDDMVRTVAEGWPALEGRYRLSWFDRRLEILSLLEKSEHSARSRATDCRYPRSALIPAVSDAGSLPADMRYPVIAKPARPLSSFKVRVLEEPAGLQRLALEHSDALPFIVQNYVAGPEERIHFCAMYLDHGRELGRFDDRKLRSKPMGHTTIAEPVRNESLHAIARRFFDGLDLSGPVSLECKFDDDGEAWIIEPTVGRTDFWMVPACQRSQSSIAGVLSPSRPSHPGVSSALPSNLVQYRARPNRTRVVDQPGAARTIRGPFAGPAVFFASRSVSGTISYASHRAEVAPPFFSPAQVIMTGITMHSSNNASPSRSTRSVHGVAAALLLLALTPWSAYAFNFTPTDAEWATWPEMCKARYATTRIGSGSTFGSQVRPAAIEQWQTQLGAAWNYVHHHCAGLIYLDRAKLETLPSQRKFLLNRSLSEHRFALEHTPPDDPFAAEIRTRIGLTLREAKQYTDALQSLDAAIAVNQRYGDAYVAKALVQRDQNKTRECLATLRAGDEATGGQSLEINHFLAVVLMQQEQFEEAREHARRAYSLGYPLPGLRDKLKAAGYPL